MMPSRRVRKRDGKPTEIVITDGDLQSYVAATQALELESGVVSRLTAGHTKPGSKDQPTLVGYGRAKSVGHFGPKRQPCVWYTLYFKPEHFQAYKDWPYRSPEFYPERDEIRGVALLMTDPELDMGMVAYESEAETPEDETPAGHDEWTKHFEHYAKRCGYLGYARQCYEGQSPMAGPSTATATNVTEPKMPTPAEEAAAKQQAEAVRMEREQNAIQYAKLEQQATADREEIKQLRESVATLVKERDRSDCERRVIQLEAEQYQLDRAEEVEALLAIPTKDGRDKHVDRIRKRYQKAPVAYNKQPIPVYGGTVEGEDKPAALSAEQVAEAVRYAKGDDEKYKDACEKLRKGEKLA
jgi:hypothetical protein